MPGEVRIPIGDGEEHGLPPGGAQNRLVTLISSSLNSGCISPGLPLKKRAYTGSSSTACDTVSDSVCRGRRFAGRQAPTIAPSLESHERHEKATGLR